MSEPAPNQVSYNYCALPLAAYACRPDRSKGRLYAQPESKHRTCFQRDRDRIIHSAAFRRLKQKSQVFVAHEGDQYRTRLTHTLEVAQIARTLARALLVNEDLAETVALAHDLGHPPFAHTGEDALVACLKNDGGFDHNDQSLRILTLLECKYPNWPGLNLTWETLEGVVKHNGPVTGDLPLTLATIQDQVDLRLETYAPLEAQTAALADDIAYNNHDVEDGLRAGLFTVEDIQDVPLLVEIITDIKQRYPGIESEGDMLVHAIVRNMIGAMVGDVLEESAQRLDHLNPQTPDDVRAADHPVVAFSAPMLAKVDELRDFLRTRMYWHEKVNTMRKKSIKIVDYLYHAFAKDPALLPEEWQKRAVSATDISRIIADYIAGMTDIYATKEYDRLSGS